MKELLEQGGMHELKKGEKVKTIKGTKTIKQDGVYTVIEGEVLILAEIPEEMGVIENCGHYLVNEDKYIKVINIKGEEEERYFVRDRWIQGTSEQEAIYNTYRQDSIAKEKDNKLWDRVRLNKRASVVDLMRILDESYSLITMLLKAGRIKDIEEREVSIGEIEIAWYRTKELGIKLYGADRINRIEEKLNTIGVGR